jgi:hypothetical protein
MRLAISSGALSGMLVDFSASKDYSATGVQTSQGPQPGAIFPCGPTEGIETTTSVANWGYAEVMAVVNTSSSTFIPGKLVQVDKNFNIALNATTDNTGAPLAVTLSNFSAGDVTRQIGWVLISGVVPVTFSVAATAGQVFLGTAGNATPTANTGGQILNATTIIAAAGNFTRTVTTTSGQSFARCKTNGLYPGIAISGTGIPASSVVASIDPSGLGIYLGSAVGTNVNATASGAVTGTFTHTGYGIVQMSRPFVQGQIT